MNVEVCFSPEILHLFKLKNKNVVVVDILRATSCMITGFAHGVSSIIPVSEIEECKTFQKTGLLAAAERDGLKVDGFDLDNSPFSYMNPELSGKTIVVTTTNGTLAITKATAASEIIIGAFLNISSVATYLKESAKDVLIICAGWKGHFNIEDTLFAGALIKKLKNESEITQDSALAALHLYDNAKEDIVSFVKKSDHVRRLKSLSITRDIDFCMRFDEYTAVPVYKNGKLENMVPVEIIIS